MPSEAVEALVTDPHGSYLDATFGRGGHSRRILQALAPDARLLAFDRDPDAAQCAAGIEDARFSFRQVAFSSLSDLAPCSLSGILLDLGVSSPQIDEPQRGFSFRADGPLDMRMDPACGMSAAQWLAQASQSQIQEVIRNDGEERFARAIAAAIVAHRLEHGPITRTLELAELVAGAVKTRERGQHPATRTFQAIRIFINSELQELDKALEGSLNVLKCAARLVVISFHSLEDRRVKQFIRAHSVDAVDRRAPFLMARPMPLKSIARLRASDNEVQANPRARSAIMRVAERTQTSLPSNVKVTAKANTKANARAHPSADSARAGGTRP